MSDRPVRVVLDTSAIIAYAQAASIDVGDVIAEVDDEYGAVALPALCLIEAARAVPEVDRGRLRVLLANPATVTVTIDPASWEQVVDLAEAGGRTDAATAALIAVDFGATMLTRRMGWYVGMTDADFQIINF